MSRKVMPAAKLGRPIYPSSRIEFSGSTHAQRTR